MPGFIILESGPDSVCSGAILRYPPTWWVTSSRTYSGLSTARSYRSPEAISTFFTPSVSRALRYRLMSGVWSVFRFLQMPGYTQLSFRQAASVSLSLQAMRHILAVGPPRSEMTPVKAGLVSRMRSTSRSTDASERL